MTLLATNTTALIHSLAFYRILNKLHKKPWDDGSVCVADKTWMKSTTFQCIIFSLFTVVFNAETHSKAQSMQEYH